MGDSFLYEKRPLFRSLVINTGLNGFVALPTGIISSGFFEEISKKKTHNVRKYNIVLIVIINYLIKIAEE